MIANRYNILTLKVILLSFDVYYLEQNINFLMPHTIYLDIHTTKNTLKAYFT